MNSLRGRRPSGRGATYDFAKNCMNSRKCCGCPRRSLDLQSAVPVVNDGSANNGKSKISRMGWGERERGETGAVVDREECVCVCGQDGGYEA